jgi:DegV family protein with EDD domain
LIEIITDSTCDIPEALVQQYHIQIVSHLVIWGDDQFRDRVDILPITFYERLVTDRRRPTTSQASVADFQQAYAAAIARGSNEIIVLTVSSAMSGAYNSALTASQLVDVPVHVIDSKGPTMTLGWQVLAAARLREAGETSENILEKVSRLRQRMVQYVGMDTLEYLQTGGRIGNAIKWMGSLLQVKPLVSINHQSGLVEPVYLTRTHKTLVETMYRHFFDHLLKKGQKLHIAVLHGNALAEAEALAERIHNEFNPEELLINLTGPVLGINTGPGALALCGYAEE